LEAEKKLTAVGRPALALLKKASKENKDAEVRDHAERVTGKKGTYKFIWATRRIFRIAPGCCVKRLGGE
jgi:hypothetical protein